MIARRNNSSTAHGGRVTVTCQAARTPAKSPGGTEERAGVLFVRGHGYAIPCASPRIAAQVAATIPRKR
jgi:hypothetical protein